MDNLIPELMDTEHESLAQETVLQNLHQKVTRGEQIVRPCDSFKFSFLISLSTLDGHSGALQKGSTTGTRQIPKQNHTREVCTKQPLHKV